MIQVAIDLSVNGYLLGEDWYVVGIFMVMERVKLSNNETFRGQAPNEMPASQRRSEHFVGTTCSIAGSARGDFGSGRTERSLAALCTYHPPYGSLTKMPKRPARSL